MKTAILSFIFLLVTTVAGFSQNVGINADGAAPDSSAMLDVKSSSKGFLMPRMTKTQLESISNPALGLMVFCTDCGVRGALAIYSGSQWNTYKDCNTSPPVAGTHMATWYSVQWKWTGNDTLVGYKFNTTNNYSSAEDLGKVLTKTETGLDCNTPYARYIWGYSSCGVSTSLILEKTTGFIGAPDTSKSYNTDTQITWKWKAVQGAAGYRWSTTNDYATATDVGTELTHTQTGLTPLTKYQAYVWAYSSNCGISSSSTLRHFTQAGPGDPATVDWQGVTYHTLKYGNQQWLKENLNYGTRVDKSADQTNNSVVEKYCYNDDEANCTTYGGLYQWAEMVQYLNGATNSNIWSPAPSGNIRGICPTGWHIPSDAEFLTLKSTITTLVAASMGSNMEGSCMRENSSYGHWDAPLPQYNTPDGNNYAGFTALGIGYRVYSGPSYWYYFHIISNFWTISGAGYNSANINGFSNTNSTFVVPVGNGYKVNGYPVRCIKD
ncbi:MAG: FISUMP domain-containing protein [Bacteroidales bacterium]